MSAGPLVSIIINNYNYGRFVGEAIESALRQTYANTEVIVVDDGSTDDSRDVIRSFGKHVVPVFKENGGQGSAYNAGFAASEGEAICFLDSDDTLFPTAMEQARVVLAGPSRPAKIQWPLTVTGVDGRATGELSAKRTPPAGDLSEMIIHDGPFYDFYLHTGALYPRWLLEKTFPVPERLYRISSDEYLTTLAPVYGQVLNHSQSLGTYRIHGRNNYCGRALDDRRIREYMARFESNCAVLAKHLQQVGKCGNVEAWKRRNFNYLWPHRLLRARQDISKLVPEGTTYILINNDEWGGAEEIRGRLAVPLMEKDGAYWGPPADEQTAFREFERLRAEGATFVVVWWTAFWWLDHYPAFARQLRDCFDCTLDAEHLIAFDLRRPPRGDVGASHERVGLSQKDNN